MKYVREVGSEDRNFARALRELEGGSVGCSNMFELGITRVHKKGPLTCGKKGRNLLNRRRGVGRD